MKRMTALFLTVAVFLSLAACTKAAVTRDDAPAEIKQALEQLPEIVAEPEGEVKPQASLKALNKACGSKIVTPENRTVTNELFETTTFDGTKVGQYVFTVDDLPCAVRFCSDIYKDASGVVNADGNPVFDGVKGDIAFAEDCIIGRWNTTAGQYVLIAATDDISAFDTLFEEFKATIPG